MLWNMFGIALNSLDDFKSTNFSVGNIKTFLEEYVEEGQYSWLVNEIMEGQIEASQEFIANFKDTIGVPERLLNAIFGGLWFDFNWEAFNITDENYIPNTYIDSLRNFNNGTIAASIRIDIENSLKLMFLYDANDFKTPFKFLEDTYNQFVGRRDWRNVLVTWAVYSTYRKVFEHQNYLKKLEGEDSSLSVVSHFNKSLYLIKRLQGALERAEYRYTKVYPHSNTAYVMYSAKNPSKVAKLELGPILSQLKCVGRAVEAYRPQANGVGRKNILVPALYFLITNQSHIRGGKHKRTFVAVDLDFPLLRTRMLTRAPEDGVFTGTKEKEEDAYYFKKAKEDYVNGQIVRGISKGDAEADFKKIFDQATGKEQSFVHSERVWLEILRNQDTVNSIVASLRSQVEKTSPGFIGTIKVYTVLALLYSTNSVCEYCTPSLIAGQNSYTPGGFLFQLAQTLNRNEPGTNIQFKTRGYDAVRRIQDHAKFRLTTIVTANTNFDSQAHDLTEAGQHRHTKIGKNNPPETHLPKGTLIFSKQAIDIHQAQIQTNGNVDPYQRFFYEFVGGDQHTSQNGVLPHRGIVFSSGSKSWGSRVPRNILR